MPAGFSINKAQKQSNSMNEGENLSELAVIGSTVADWVKSESPSMWPQSDLSKAVPKARENIIKMGEGKRPKF